MKDKDKTKQQLIAELAKARHRIRALEADPLTGRSQTEATLRDSEQRFRNIVESSPMGMHMYRLESNDRLVFVGANPAANRLLGVDNSQFIGKTIEEAFPPLAETEVPERYRRAAQMGEPWQTEQIEYEDAKINGAFEVYAFQTSPGKMVALFLEITERKRIEEALKESEEKYRHMVENINDVIFAMDREGVFTYMSPTIVTFTELEPGEIVGQHYSDFVHPDDQPKLSRLFGERLAGKIAPAEYRIMTRSGGLRWVRSSSRPLISGGEIVGLQGVLVDITEAKKAEEEREHLETQLRHIQKMEAIGQLAGGIAHDFNNLLSPILGYAELLFMELHPDDPRFGSVEQIHKAANRARDLTRHLTAFGRKQVIEMKPLDLNDSVSGFEKMLRRTIREDIEIQLRLNRSPSPVLADISMIEQILMNLAVNAQDAMPDGGTLSIETDELIIDKGFCREHPEVQPGRHITLVVRDTGIGIEDENLERLFEPFFTTKEKGKGTGLGLATVYGIVKQHNGAIRASSVPGKGTTFTIYFPRAEKTVETTHEKTFDLTSNHGSETVVVVEDDEMVRTLACSILRDHGYDIIEARDAKECMSLIEALDRPVDLLLTDIVMPGTNGYELYKRLLESIPELKAIFMSGYVDKMSDREAVPEDLNDFIQKPFSIQTLTRKVRTALDR
jgi:PAS domain S-box-containing protein